jgi:hypothetical protein
MKVEIKKKSIYKQNTIKQPHFSRVNSQNT